MQMSCDFIEIMIEIDPLINCIFLGYLRPTGFQPNHSDLKLRIIKIGLVHVWFCIENG